jgi:serine/threonine protein kinase
MNDSEHNEESLFEQCLELPPGERVAFLESSCAGDSKLKEGVLGLLRSHETAGGFMETSPEEDSADVAKRLQRIAPAEESPGDQIGRYRLLELIGEGAWGSVWMAQQTEDIERRVALKILKLGLDTKDFLARFEAERQMLAMMDHPNIARVLDAGATDYGRPYLVMELVKGMPLLEYADKRRLSIADRVKLFIKICQAAHHAHQKGIIHRDLKPSNILVSEQDNEAVPKVIDFGVAKTNQLHLTDKTLFTSIHSFIGTPVYSSPEQLEFTGTDVDPRSDVYSLGALLYEFLCGNTPFDYDQLSKEGMEAFRTEVREKNPPRPSQRFEGLSAANLSELAEKRQCPSSKVVSRLKGDLDWIIMKCLEKEPGRRYDSAQALANDLQAYLVGNPVSAAAPSPVYRIRKYITRKRPAYSVWLEVSLVLVVILALYSFLRPRPAGPPPIEFELTQQMEDPSSRITYSEKSIAVLPFVNMSSDPENEYLSDGITEEILNALANVPELRVPARTSSFMFKGKTDDIILSRMKFCEKKGDDFIDLDRRIRMIDT